MPSPPFEVHLVDGTYELFRHHFAVPSHLDHDGIEVAATRGVLGSVLGMLEQGATHVGVATDHVVESFRNDLWLGYKTSEGMDPELLTQFPMLEDALRALGVTVWAMVEVEADDGLASAARVARDDPRVDRVYICTPDKDLGQCVEDPKVMQLDRRHDRRLDEAAVRERFGVGPQSIPDYLALVGDTADGFPGLPGWGAKSTATVLAALRAPGGDPRRRARVGGRGTRRGQARGHARRRARSGGAVPPPRHVAHRRRRRHRRRVGVARRGPRTRGVGTATRRREPRGPDRTPGDPAGRLMEVLHLEVGPYRFRALADGPVDGELVLLLHGFPETSYLWRHQLATLGAAGYRAVAPDQRGYTPGARPDDVAEYHVDHLVADVLGVADALGAERFHLVGHDWGGFIAWYTGGRHGDRLRTLTVVSTPHPTPFAGAMKSGSSDQRERSGYMQWFRSADAEAAFLADDAALLDAIYAEHPPDAAAEYRRVFTADGGAALTGGLNWYRANNFRAAIGAITVPTLYVWSTADVALGREAAEGTAAEVAGPYRFEVLDDVSHWIPEVAPDALDALLLEHLASGRSA